MELTDKLEILCEHFPLGLKSRAGARQRMNLRPEGQAT